ncbi:hypothetical protein K458DRAFT_134601 [Lentithecium fluviatile CBS 122367]|uniref:Uncharacterized protein n=1 Tax=Lentithecium fluviatile CBS 122367 TaxID=1168545 RepID=A0A6G1ILC8_9PLEO|nr:hypothetical protein K458DRAFT_134601 [Lentithecium fluviatile CBS 122367]
MKRRLHKFGAIAKTLFTGTVRHCGQKISVDSVPSSSSMTATRTEENGKSPDKIHKGGRNSARLRLHTTSHHIASKMPVPTTPTPDSDPPANKTIQTSASDQLNKDWKAMRELSTQSGHVHNRLCPYWRPGDTAEPGPECPNKTFTMFSINPFTKEGQAHKKLLDERDWRLKEAKDGQAEAEEGSMSVDIDAKEEVIM